MKTLSSDDSTMDNVLDWVRRLLEQCWTDTGFGEFTIESERIKPDVVRVFIRGTVHRKFLVRVARKTG